MVGGFCLPVSFVTGLLTRHLPFTPFSSVVLGSVTDFGGNHARHHHTPTYPSSSHGPVRHQLYQTAFYNCRTPRSQEYKAGARMALEHRIERNDFDMP